MRWAGRAVRPVHQVALGDCRRLFVLGEGRKDEFANALLPGRVNDGTQEREAPTVAVHGAGVRKRDVPATPRDVPDAEADELQAGKR